MTAPQPADARNQMVTEQVANRGITDVAVLAAMRAVPREAFVPENLRKSAYRDGPLPIGYGQTISQPYMVAAMISHLALQPDEQVLEIGTGCGYAAAVLANIVERVHTVERIPQLALQARQHLANLGLSRVNVHVGDGTTGLIEHAPFDAIVVAASGPVVPEPLKRQLGIGGRLVVPVGRTPKSQQLVRVTRRRPTDFVTETLGGVRFVPLIGSNAWQDDSWRMPNRLRR